jgi:hypothetical protein
MIALTLLAPLAVTLATYEVITSSALALEPP